MKYIVRTPKPIRGLISLLLIILLLVSFMGCAVYSNIEMSGNPIEEAENKKAEVIANNEAGSIDEGKSLVKDILTMHVLDVGQADSILIKTGASAMLIDGGNNEDAETIIKYIKAQGISKLDYVIGTHPHEDHIGSLDQVVKTFTVEKVIMPKVQANTKTFEDLLDAIIRKGLKITAPVPGTVYKLGEAEFTILAPNGTGYEDINNYSVVIKLVHGSNSILLTGDAEDVSEREMLAKGYDLSANILKVGHHGSNSSSTTEFLKVVNPTLSVISVGKDNPYGLPGSEAIKRISGAGAEILRTDQVGTIVITSDGSNIKVDKNTQDINAPAQTSAKYIGNINSKIFHLPVCKSLPEERNRIYFESRDAAENNGYTPCKNCNP